MVRVDQQHRPEVITHSLKYRHGNVVKYSVQNFSYRFSATIASYSIPCLVSKLRQKCARRTWQRRSENPSGASASSTLGARCIRGRFSGLKAGGRNGIRSSCLESTLVGKCQKWFDYGVQGIARTYPKCKGCKRLYVASPSRARAFLKAMQHDYGGCRPSVQRRWLD
jgi:hypothetical protein